MRFHAILRRIFRPTFNRKLPKYTLLVLIDFHDHHRGGHFGSWLHWFGTEFDKRFDRVVVLTPDPKKTRMLFQEKGGNSQGSFSFAKLSQRFQKHFDLDDLLGSMESPSYRTHAFVMWGYDLLEFKSLRQSRYPWATLIGVSWICRSQRDDIVKKEKKLLGMLEKDISCKGFFQPDFYLRNRHSKGVWITDIEDMVLCEKETLLLKKIRAFGKRQLCVGVFGMLYGYRCVDEILLLARAQPKVNFVLAGEIFYDSIRKDLVNDLESDHCNNVLVLPGFIKTDSELNAAISSVDAIFIDSAKYPVQSGVVCRAIHFGRWILSSEGNSWTNDIIAESGVGFTYNKRAIDLYQAWTTWKKSGGEKRSKGLSIKLRDPLTVASCFDELTRRLMQSN